jgi:hypothetical protein
VDRAIHTASTQKRAVCRVHDGVTFEAGDVAFDELDHVVGSKALSQ